MKNWQKLILIVLLSLLSLKVVISKTPLYEHELKSSPEVVKRIIKLYYTRDFKSCYEEGLRAFWRYPDDTTTLVFALSSAIRLNKLEEVSRDVEDELFSGKANPQLAHTFLGFVSLILYSNTGQEEYLRDAKDEFLEAISGSEMYASSLSGLGITYYLSKLDLKALWNLERSYKLNPTDPVTAEYLARTYRKLNRIPKALKVLDAMLKLYPYPDGYFLKGIMLMERERYQEALEALLDCERTDEANVSLKVTCLVRASDTALKMGDKERAITLLQEALKIEPDNPWVSYKLKRLTEKSK